MASVPESLIKFEEPLSLGSGPNNNNGGRDSATAVPEEGKSGSTQKCPKTTSGSTQVDQILDSILPPRTWTSEDKDGGKFMSYTSKQPATRLDCISLQEELDRKLAERQARDSGICPVREDLYSQGFDELIRQVTLNQPERGLLLLRIRDEALMTRDAYKTLYDSSIVFGIRKQLQAESGMQNLEEEIKELEESCKSKENEVLELRNRVEMMEKRENEMRTLADQKRKEEIAFLKYQGQNLDKFLKSVSGS